MHVMLCEWALRFLFGLFALSQRLCILLTSRRILGGSYNNEWTLEEANDDNDDMASCMETNEDENGEQISYIKKLMRCAA